MLPGRNVPSARRRKSPLNPNPARLVTGACTFLINLSTFSTYNWVEGSLAWGSSAKLGHLGASVGRKHPGNVCRDGCGVA